VAFSVLLDLDGTLTDPRKGITRCIRYSLESLGEEAPPEENLTWCIGPPLRDSFASLLGTGDRNLLDRAVELYRERFSAAGMFENEPYPGIHDALDRIRNAGCRIFLATSKPRIFAVKILRHFRLDGYFHGIHGSRLDGGLSDKTELVAHVLRAGKLDPGRSLMVGDRCHDILGGRANGTLTAGASWGFGSVEELLRAGPDLIFDSPGEMAVFLEKSADPFHPLRGVDRKTRKEKNENPFDSRRPRLDGVRMHQFRGFFQRVSLVRDELRLASGPGGPVQGRDRRPGPAGFHDVLHGRRKPGSHGGFHGGWKVFIHAGGGLALDRPFR
jgi:phosphoglycolate phosphatase